MAGEHDPQIFTPSPEDRQSEQQYIQRRSTAPTLERGEKSNVEAMEDAILEYGRQLAPLFEYINEIDTWMRQMRLHNIPDVQAYEELRKRLTDAHEKASRLHIRVGEIADGLLGAPDVVRQNAEAVSDSMQAVFERVEDAFQDALGAHDAWLKEHAGEIPYGRRERDYGPYVERPLASELYDQRVMELQEKAVAIEEEVDAMSSPSPKQVTDVRVRIERLQAKLLQLDEKTESPLQSRERKSFVGMLERLHERLDKFGAPASEDVLPELELLLTPEEYEAGIQKLRRDVREWQRVAETLEQSGKLTKEVRQDMLEELRKYPDQLLQLDEKADEPESSIERAALVDALKELRSRLSDEFYISEKRNIQASDVAVASGVYERVKASYASVQHALTVDQRRELRAQIATLAALVKNAQEERSETLRAAVHASVARATEHAPAIANAAFWVKR